ncbi:GspE/PulE family protein [Thiobacter aerophilum]|uniref:ATPase, T2SS/T4P/T4SS family n=1 Tax=Thiobacter aerophilum TaxID=3121275 RepID=A0ABV0EHX9_9BURK
MARPEKVRLGEILVNQKLISQEQLALALEEQKRTGRKLGRIFVEQGFVTEEQISEALARQLNIPYINLKFYQLRPEVVRLLPETQARRFRAIVMEVKDNTALVGMADPTDLFAYDEIARILKRDLSLAVVNEGQLMEAIDRLYRRTDEITDLAHELEVALGDTAVDFGLLGATPSLEDAPIVRLLQTVFEDATQVRASDIHIEPQEKTLRIRFRIDGVLHLQTEVDPKIATALALRLKLMSGLDIAEKRLPQDGRFHVRVKNRTVDVRISTLPTQYGESVVMRLLNQDEGAPPLEQLGFPATMLGRFREIFHRAQGMVLVTGPTGSGKTTTLYSVLAELNAVERKIITVEDPVEYRLPGINQVQVNEKIDLTFSRVLRTVLRQDPDIVLVGEMRDQETAQMGMRAAMTGHMVLSTLHTNDAVSTPIRLLDMGVPPYMVAMSVHAVLAQRLLRLVCDSCMAAYMPLPHELAWLELELGPEAAQRPWVQGRGCSHCNGTGYRGRVGVYEMLEMTAPLVEALNRQDTQAFVRLARQQLAGRTLRRAAVDLAVAGRTSVAEAMRVTSALEDN